MPVQGVEVSTMNNPSLLLAHGPFGTTWTVGLMLERRWGNGLGAPLRAQRVDSMGVQLWPSFIGSERQQRGARL